MCSVRARSSSRRLVRSDARSRPDYGSSPKMELVWLSRPVARCSGAAEYGSVRNALKSPHCQLIPSPNLAGSVSAARAQSRADVARRCPGSRGSSHSKHRAQSFGNWSRFASFLCDLREGIRRYELMSPCRLRSKFPGARPIHRWAEPLRSLARGPSLQVQRLGSSHTGTVGQQQGRARRATHGSGSSPPRKLWA